jgi:Ca2+-binding EF-hand superfamily protein
MRSLRLRRPSTSSIPSRRVRSTREVLVSPTSDLKASLDSLGYEAQNQTIYQMIVDLESDGGGNIGFNDFLQLMTSRVSDKDSRENMKKVFNLFDDDKTGYISIKNLRKIVRDLGENIEEHELQEMIDKADSDRDGMVSEEDFYMILTKKGPSTH